MAASWPKMSAAGTTGSNFNKKDGTAYRSILSYAADSKALSLISTRVSKTNNTRRLRSKLSNSEAKDRILACVGKNEPTRKHEFEVFPPDKFPIKLHLIFGKRDRDLPSRLTAKFKEIAEGKIRYRVTHNRYTNSTSMRCYFNTIGACEAAIEGLEGQNLWTDELFHDKQVSVNYLIEQARQYTQTTCQT